MNKKYFAVIFLLCCIVIYYLCIGIFKENYCKGGVAKEQIYVILDDNSFCTFFNIAKKECELKKITCNIFVLRKESYEIPSNEDLKKYLNMTCGEIEEMTGSNIENMLSILPFPVIYSKETYWFIFDSWKDDEFPRYVAFYEEVEDKFLCQLGIENCTNFAEIMRVMGEAQITKGKTCEIFIVIKDGIGDKEYYKMEYQRNGLRYVFISETVDGRDFQFYVGLAK